MGVIFGVARTDGFEEGRGERREDHGLRKASDRATRPPDAAVDRHGPLGPETGAHPVERSRAARAVSPRTGVGTAASHGLRCGVAWDSKMMYQS